MLYALLADIVHVAHLAFILYVVFGGLLVWRWPRSAWLHVPVALYGVAIEWIGWTCPLTPLEKYLRRLAGESAYPAGFIDHYLRPIIYPEGLTPRIQILLGTVVVLVNLAVYGNLLWSWRGGEE